MEQQTGTNRLYLVRHGQSVANVTYEFSYRKVDPPLTEIGVLQAQCAAAHLKSIHIDEMYTSPMVRAVQTAEIFREALGVDFEIVEEFREVNVGDLEDQPPTEEAWNVHRRVLADWGAGTYDSSFPNGEDYHSLAGRARRALAKIVAGKSGRSILIVGHGGIFVAAVDALCPEVRLADIYRLGTGNCAITTLDVQAVGDDLRGTLSTWADRAHMASLSHLDQHAPPPWASRQG